MLCTPPEPDAPQRESAGHGMPRRGLQKAVGPDTCAVMLAQPLVGEQSQPSKPPCPSQHPHVAVLVTQRWKLKICYSEILPPQVGVYGLRWEHTGLGRNI